jgi:putative hydrolase of the HAD superfamily
MAVRAFLFDFDGLILDTELASRAGWQLLYREHGHELPTDLWATLVGTTHAPWDPMAHLEELVGEPLEREALNERRHAHEIALIEAEAICTADRDRARAKPSPTLYLEALDALGVAAFEAVAFEDSPNGVLAARAAGVYCVAIPNEVTRELGLEEAGADLVLDSLADLPPDELLARLVEA